MADEARTISSNMKGAAGTPGSGGSAAEHENVAGPIHGLFALGHFAFGWF